MNAMAFSAGAVNRRDKPRRSSSPTILFHPLACEAASSVVGLLRHGRHRMAMNQPELNKKQISKVKTLPLIQLRR
jgi:hypothetical protein